MANQGTEENLPPLSNFTEVIFIIVILSIISSLRFGECDVLLLLAKLYCPRSPSLPIYLISRWYIHCEGKKKLT